MAISVAASNDTSTDVVRTYSSKFKFLLIPFGLLADTRFSIKEKALLAEIYTLERNEKRGCWASNAHFGGLLNVSERQVRKDISKLEAAGHIRSANRDSTHRQLWIGDELRAQIELGENPPRRIDSAEQISSGVDADDARTRKKDSGTPGNNCENTALGFRDTRTPGSTENTLRTQQENTKETRMVGGFSLPNWMPASLWDEWLAHLKSLGRSLRPADMQAQIKKLEELDSNGHEFRSVINYAIEKGWKDLYPLPKFEAVALAYR